MRHAILVIFLALAVCASLALTDGAFADLRPGSSAPSETLMDYVASLSVKSGSACRNLTIFPLVSGDAPDITGTLTLDEALRKDALEISESGGGDVNTIIAENTSSKKVFIMAGEILTGAKQDRVLKNDVLLPARSGRVKLACFCVEHGRWSYKSDDKSFSSRSNVSNINVRQAAREKKEQGEVWGAVATTQSKVSAAPASGALDETYRAPTVSSTINTYVDRLRNLPDRYSGMVGVVVVIDDEVLCADIFASPRIFEALWPKLLKSYALEALSSGSSRGSDDIDLARSFLKRLRSAEFDTLSTPGSGRLIEISSSRLSGSALVYGDAVLHADMFPRMKGSTKKNYEEQQPIYRNQQLR